MALSGNLVSMDTQFVRLYLDKKFADNPDNLRLIPIQTARGPVPLATLATITYGLTANKIERNQMLYSLDVSGYRRTRPVSILTARYGGGAAEGGYPQGSRSTSRAISSR